jgi:hypothetical protein
MIDPGLMDNNNNNITSSNNNNNVKKVLAILWKVVVNLQNTLSVMACPKSGLTENLRLFSSDIFRIAWGISRSLFFARILWQNLFSKKWLL